MSPVASSLTTTPTLSLGVIGNCAVSALVDREGTIVWSCQPRVDGDPVFHALLGGANPGDGAFAIELEDFARSEQAYVENTAVLRTRLWDVHGQGLEITDFAPRFRSIDRVVIMRRADIELRSTAHQHVIHLRQTLPQILALFRAVCRVRHLDIVTDNYISAATRDIRANPACQHRWVALIQTPRQCKAIRRPLIQLRGFQPFA